jgi:hypothetical protein
MMIAIIFGSCMLGILIFAWSIHSLARKKILLENNTLIVKKGEKVLREINILAYVFSSNVLKHYNGFLLTSTDYMLILKNHEEGSSIPCNFLGKEAFNLLISTIRKYQKNLIGVSQEQENSRQSQAEKSLHFSKVEISETKFIINKTKAIRKNILKLVFAILGIVCCLGIFGYYGDDGNIYLNHKVFLLIIVFFLFYIAVKIGELYHMFVHMPGIITIDDHKIAYASYTFEFDNIDRIEINPASQAYQQAIKIFTKTKVHSVKFDKYTRKNPTRGTFPEYEQFYLLLEECMHYHDKLFITKVA